MENWILGKEPKPYVDEMVPVFKELWSLLGIKYDYFIRTTDENHKEVVKNILTDLETKGDIYKDLVSNWVQKASTSCLPRTRLVIPTQTPYYPQ